MGEHDEGCWIEVDPSGTVTAPDGRKVSRSYFRIFRLRDPALWQFLGFPREDATMDGNTVVEEVFSFPAEWCELLGKRRGPISQEVGAEIYITEESEDPEVILVRVRGTAIVVDDCLDKLEQLVAWA